MFILKGIKVNGIININDLTIPDYKVTSITGQSGSGKSTFLRLLNNLDSPDEGEIYFKEESLQSIDPIKLRRNVMMVPQIPTIFEGSIKDNLELALNFAEKDQASDEKMNNALHNMMLTKSLTDTADDLSGGEKQRLALARAILMDAEVYLLDEPSSSLDNRTADTVIKTFIEFVKQNDRTVIMVTHDEKLAFSISENTVDMDEYKIISQNEGD